MKRSAIILMTAILGLTVTAMADVKVKTRQTMSGQVSESVSYIKGKRQRSEVMDGMMVSITQCDLGRDLQLNPQTKTYMVNLYDDGTTGDPVPVPNGTTAPVTKGGTMLVTTTLKDTGERKQMFGYTARHIIQTVVMESSPDACVPTNTKMEMDMWVIDAEFGLDCPMMRNYIPRTTSKAGGCKDKIQQKTIGTAKSGYPLYQKMTSFDASGKESYSMIQEVIELSKATLDQALFEAPKDYREVKDSAEMYATAATSGVNLNGSDTGVNYTGQNANTNPSLPSSTGLGSSVSKAAATQPDAGSGPAVGAKQPGIIRLGVPTVKTGAVGEGISAADLGAAIRNTLGEFLKGTKVEIVPLEARLAAAQTEEARQKECDYVVYASVSHKKGGGGFGFGKVLSAAAPMLPMAGGMGGYIAGQVINTAISTASMAGNVKKKDEINLELKVHSAADNSATLARQFKKKAQSDGDDIISAIVEEAAQAIIDALGK